MSSMLRGMVGHSDVWIRSSRLHWTTNTPCLQLIEFGLARRAITYRQRGVGQWREVWFEGGCTFQASFPNACAFDIFRNIWGHRWHAAPFCLGPFVPKWRLWASSLKPGAQQKHWTTWSTWSTWSFWRLAMAREVNLIEHTMWGPQDS